MSNICLLDFNSQDVCTILDIQDASQACQNLDDDERRQLSYSEIQSIVGNPDITRLSALSEGGLYQLIFRSNKPDAKAFRKWICNVVIPSIRQTGTYKSPQAIQIERWLKVRETSRLVSQLFTASCIKNGYNAGYIHDQITIAITGKDAKELREYHEVVSGNVKVGLNHIQDIQELESVTELKLRFASLKKKESQSTRLDRVLSKHLTPSQENPIDSIN